MLKKRCEMCSKRKDLFTYGGMKLCSGCKSTMKQCDNQRAPQEAHYSGAGEVMRRER